MHSFTEMHAFENLGYIVVIDLKCKLLLVQIYSEHPFLSINKFIAYYSQTWMRGFTVIFIENNFQCTGKDS